MWLWKAWHIWSWVWKILLCQWQLLWQLSRFVICVYKLVIVGQGFQQVVEDLFLNWNMFSRFIDCFSCCSITHNMLMVIIDVSSITMTCAFLKCSMILLGSRRMDKYFHVETWNVVCILMVVEFKWNATTPMVVNNTFCPSNWKFCVIYFKK